MNKQKQGKQKSNRNYHNNYQKSYTSAQPNKSKSTPSQMKEGDIALCMTCTYCWKQMNICSAMGSFVGYGCKMYDNEVTHMKYPDYMKTNRYPTNNQKRMGQK